MEERMTDLPIGTIALAGGGALGVAPYAAASDQAAIAAWAPDVVLTLLERGPRADAVGAVCAALDVAWHHLPIDDFNAPDAAFEAGWEQAGAVLRDHLRSGRRVLVHCLAGRGRSGTIAARLLVEVGAASPDQAIEAVRAVRPGAVETPDQEAHVRASRPKG
jgi:ADP-ribosyl-[dinitrogen reductase] hydrolase